MHAALTAKCFQLSIASLWKRDSTVPDQTPLLCRSDGSVTARVTSGGAEWPAAAVLRAGGQPSGADRAPGPTPLRHRQRPRPATVRCPRRIQA